MANREPVQLPSSPPEAWEPLLRVARLAGRPLERFLRVQAASGILLLIVSAIALIWANSEWHESYFRLWDTPIGISAGGFQFERSLAWVVNDGLMVIFFFVVGLEIRREIHHGELSDLRRAALPVAAAFGGMAIPAAVYLLIAREPAAQSGWGVPMATDIAFALGVLAVLDDRVPPALRVLLLALAVIDDLGAILVIALFYSEDLAPLGFAVAGGGFAVVLLMQRFGVRTKALYILPTIVVWSGIYAAGIHPTIAGVIVGLVTPVRAWLGPDGFVRGVREQLETLAKVPEGELSNDKLLSSLTYVDVARREAMSPAESLIESLHPWVAFLVMPIFALTNAGVQISLSSLDAAGLQVLLGSSLGLLVGKPVGILLACWLALKLKVAVLPVGITHRHLVLLGLVAGIGFTMSLFIAQLAFGDPSSLNVAKLGVLLASGAAAVIALGLGFVMLRKSVVPGAAKTADEAESSTNS